MTIIPGTPGDDVLSGTAGNDAIYGNGGSDAIAAFEGNDTVFGDDTVQGSLANGGDDSIDGGEGDDVLYGVAGDDTLGGGAGDDVLTGGGGDDRLDGGADIDTAWFSGAFTDYTLTLIAPGVVRAVDNRSTDGTDIVRDVEALIFLGGYTAGSPDIYELPTQLLPLEPDTQGPLVAGTSPGQATVIGGLSDTIALEFDEMILAGAGSITIRRDDGSVWRTFAANDPAVRIDGRNLIVDPPDDLEDGRSYTVHLGQGVVTDDAGNANAATQALRFYTPGAPLTADDHLRGVIGGEININSSTLLANDAAGLTITSVVGTSANVVVIVQPTGTGAISVYHRGTTAETGTLSYTAVDGSGVPHTGTVEISFDNNRPIAADRTVFVIPGMPVTVNWQDVLAAASDPDGDNVSLAYYGPIDPDRSGFGTLSATAGSITFTPSVTYTGGYTLGYGVEDDADMGEVFRAFGSFGLGNIIFTVASAPAAASVRLDGPGIVLEGSGSGPAGTLAFVIERSGGSTGAATVTFTLGAPNGGTLTAGDIAQVRAGSTVLAGSGGAYAVAFAAGETSKTIHVRATADAIAEPDERVVLTLTGGTGVTLGSVTSSTGTILNDDPYVFNGTSRADTLTGTATLDILNGLNGNDRLSGLDGDDTLDGGAGRDTMDGGAGNDTYIVDNSRDSVTEAGNGGYDTVRTPLSSLTLAANVEAMVYTGTRAFAGTGNSGDNTITGAGGADMLNGGRGNDYLRGLGGADTLSGGDGDDALEGGAGSDRLLGEAGNDTFVFDAADITGRRTALDGGTGFDAFFVSGAATVNTTGAPVARIEAVVVASSDTAAQTVIVNLDEVAAESTNGAGADANVFLALLGGGADTLDFTGAGWTQTASFQNVAAGTSLPAGAVALGGGEAAVVNGIWGGQAIDPATGLGTAVGLDLYVFTRGAQIVTVWTDAETVI